MEVNGSDGTNPPDSATNSAASVTYPPGAATHSAASVTIPPGSVTIPPGSVTNAARLVSETASAMFLLSAQT
ncbi:hypothetical protein ACFQ7I_24645 [Streptomyces massasporeus]